ncbi:hypothetical protein FRC10_009520 [Ceratobasidium sp. 414]|nr:hypothetical protein FRC10_009520 [Ceratobasidium sp. 414]
MELRSATGYEDCEELKPIEAVHPWYYFQLDEPGHPPLPTQIFSSAQEHQRIFDYYMSQVLKGFYDDLHTGNSTELPPPVDSRGTTYGKSQPPQIATSSASALDHPMPYKRSMSQEPLPDLGFADETVATREEHPGLPGVAEDPKNQEQAYWINPADKRCHCKVYKCPCQRIYKRVYEWKRHHDYGNKHNPCPYCGQSFTRSYRLKNHIETKHNA